VNGEELAEVALWPKSSAENVQYARAVKDREKTGYFIEIKRQWKSGDKD